VSNAEVLVLLGLVVVQLQRIIPLLRAAAGPVARNEKRLVAIMKHHNIPDPVPATVPDAVAADR
jgi:hypothetical protein